MKKFQSGDLIKFLKTRNNLVALVILIIGVILMTSVSGGKAKKEVKQTFDVAAQEDRLENILSAIEGAGHVKVMITYRGGSEQRLAYEIKSETEENSHQEDKRAVMSGNSPVVVRELYPEVRGVIVVAEGAGDINIKRALTEAVSASMGIGVSNVRVYKEENKNAN